MKLLSALNFLLALIIFPLVLGLCYNPLLLGLSILYCASSTALLSFGYNNNYIKGHDKEKAITVLANITALLALLTCIVEYLMGVGSFIKIVSAASIIFIGGCILLFCVIQNRSDISDN